MSEQERSLHKPTDNLGARDRFQRGVTCLWRQDRADNEEGMKLLRQAIALDAEFGRAHGYLAFGDCLLLFYERADNRDEVLSRGIKAANRALAIDRRDYFAHHAAGRLCTLSGDHRGAVRALETCIDINPNFLPKVTLVWQRLMSMAVIRNWRATIAIWPTGLARTIPWHGMCFTTRPPPIFA